MAQTSRLVQMWIKHIGLKMVGKNKLFPPASGENASVMFVKMAGLFVVYKVISLL